MFSQIRDSISQKAGIIYSISNEKKNFKYSILITTHMKLLFNSIFILLLLSACIEDQHADMDINTPDLEFLNAQFQYVNSVNMYGVAADQWADNSHFTFYYISDSETGKPQGRFI